jgi:FlaA1/EpsC-like NDP-sugar epimerase/EAL domain-containing protein (putative c-di-GMP-specific phosphodiesterase class I)
MANSRTTPMMNTLLTRLLKLNNYHLFICDVIGFSITPLLALTLRLDGHLAFAENMSGLAILTVLFLAVKLTILFQFGFYKRYWRYAGVDELSEIATLMAAFVILQNILFTTLHFFSGLPISNLPLSLPFLDGLLSCLVVGGTRFSLRIVERANQKQKTYFRRERVLIVGAGNAGVSLVHEMQRNPQLGMLPVAFIDDDAQKFNLRIRKLQVVGNRHDIPKVVTSLNIRKVIIAIPSAAGKDIREIVDICKATGVQTSTLPAIHEILNGKVRLDSIRDIRIEDLLRREPVQTDIARVSQFLRGKKVLITGAGGSIGSELCRQILKCRPEQMMLVGHGENSVFNIQQELQQVLQLLQEEGEAQEHIPNLLACIADIRFRSRIEYIFEQYKPDVVFHAAAHKHVPLMELNPPEAITNNVIGTKNLLDLSLENDVEHFVMISTDKAVNPTNVMGASKRTAEMLVLQAARQSGKSYVAVRFGNVLGSRGSVVPTFQKQIAAGGPITVTHPDICRYFMTIPEAVQLVLQASVLGRSGEVMMLNMGEPVKIVDLATELIRLSGYEVGKDIEIKFSGLRPGEKLFEELFIEGEEYEPTDHEKLFVVKNASRIIPNHLISVVEQLCQAAKSNDANAIVYLMEQIVPGYKPKHEKRGLFATSNSSVLEPTRQQESTTTIQSSTTSHPMAKELQRALDNRELCLFYQPILRLHTSDIIGFETMLRWQHPEKGLIAPDKFFSAAEETGLIISMGWWMLREACQQMGAWQQQDSEKSSLTIGVKLFSKQFYHPDLSRKIEDILLETNLDARNLVLEISEDVILEDFDAALDVLSQLKALEIKLQIDNFGISNAFFNGTQQFTNMLNHKFDKLKVDSQLVKRMENDSDSWQVVQSILKTAQKSGVNLIADGLETAKQMAQVKSFKSVYGQGYLFANPVGLDGMKTLITANN